MFNFTTGPTLVPDIGSLGYNGCNFSPLFATEVSGAAVKDNAQRTVKYMELTITADGFVTTPVGANGINVTMAQLQLLLTAQGGYLKYTGRGYDIVVNAPGQANGLADVAWGPVPELLDFQPLGGGLSAKVKWQVKVRFSPLSPALRRAAGSLGPLLQFNFETAVTYNEDGFSSLSIRGTLEIPLTRLRQPLRTLTATVDDFRSEVERRIMTGIDLTRFRVTRREFPVSRDKRTMEWEFQLEELPYMDLPPACTIARGTYSFRPAKAGMGLAMWLCTLRCTYTVRNDRARRVAWWAFLALLRLRMSQSQLGNIPAAAGNQNPIAPGAIVPVPPIVQGAATIFNFFRGVFQAQNQSVAASRKAWLIDFSGDEGLHLDSKTTSFSASWRLVTTFSHILLASGLWKKLPERDGQGNNLWATSVRDISGQQSWLPNKLDPALDVIVDFGS